MSDTISISAAAANECPPLPSVADLGRQLASIDAAHHQADKASIAARQRKDEREHLAADAAMTETHNQGMALRNLIATLPAETMADAAVQLSVARDFASMLESSEPDAAQDRKLAEALDQILRSAEPVITKAAGLGRHAVADTHEPSDAESGTHPDAVLIAACAAFNVLEAQYGAVCRFEDQGTPEETANAKVVLDRITAEQDTYVATIFAARPTTREGHAARARSLVVWDSAVVAKGGGDTGQRLTHAIVRDLLESEPTVDA